MSTVERPFLSVSESVPAFDVRRWVLRMAAAGLFLALGLTKFRAQSLWVRLFAEIGLGDWFRYLTGALQAAAGLLFLAPRTVVAASVLAGGTMVGAALVHLFVLDTGIGGAIVPLALLVFIVVVSRRQT
jgi:hypothetical protein